MNNILHLPGVKVIISEHCKTVEEVYKPPRSRKKRIIKKCRKNRKRYTRIETPQIYMMNIPTFGLFKTGLEMSSSREEKTIMVHPEIYSQILRESALIETVTQKTSISNILLAGA